MKKVINKAGSSGKRYWYHVFKTFPWEPHKMGFMSHSKAEQAEVREHIEKLMGAECPSLTIEQDKFRRFLESREKALGQWGSYDDPNYKKSLEYFLTLELIDFRETDTYIDIGSWFSPFPELIRSRVEKVYCQDLAYRQGFYQDQIGCSAAHIPLPDQSVDSMTLHCTFEHFEKNTDTLFIREAQRLLKPGGKCFIVPLYLDRDFINLTDPSLFSLQRLELDQGAAIVRRFGFLNRFGRIYSPEELVKRVISVAAGLQATVFWIREVPWLPITRLISFALMLERKSG